MDEGEKQEDGEKEKGGRDGVAAADSHGYGVAAAREYGGDGDGGDMLSRIMELRAWLLEGVVLMVCMYVWGETTELQILEEKRKGICPPRTQPKNGHLIRLSNTQKW